MYFNKKVIFNIFKNTLMQKIIINKNLVILIKNGHIIIKEPLPICSAKLKIIYTD